MAGWGISNDAYHITGGEPEGKHALAAMQQALTAGGLSAADIKHVNAHATSTPVGDIPESLAISELMGDSVGDALVSATKSMTGHLLGGTGAVEAILTAKALQTRTAPPTINIDEVDPKVVGINIVRDTPAELPAGDIAAITNSFGFGGHNAVVAFRSV